MSRSDSAADPLATIAIWRTRLAWLGELPRLAWWQTDVLTPESGGAMLETILPRTHGWAAIQIAWACAATVEARLAATPGTLSLFRLGPDVDARLNSWLRERKRLALPTDQVVPRVEVGHIVLEDTLAAWGLRQTGTTRPPPGVSSFKLGNLRRSGFGDDAAIAVAAEQLAAGYRHGRRGEPVVPFLEVV